MAVTGRVDLTALGVGFVLVQALAVAVLTGLRLRARGAEASEVGPVPA